MGTNGLDLTALLDDVEKGTEQLVDGAARLSDADVAAPSLLPAWTRGHVLTHLARNADGLVNLLTWARTGVETPMYAGGEARDADIETGAPRPAAEQLEDLRTASARFAEACRTMPEEAWTSEMAIRHRAGMVLRAADVPWMRLREVSIHHVDLDAGYTPAHWPVAFVGRCISEVTAQFGTRHDTPPLELYAEDTDRRFQLAQGGGAPVTVVSGPEAALLAWLIGRSRGDGLDVDPDGPLPTLPAWT